MNIIQKNNVLSFIIGINILIFLLIRTLIKLEYIDPNFIETFNFLVSSTDIRLIIKNPWTLITQMFTHINPGHIISNLIVLYIFGTIFLKYLNNKQLFNTYIFGGIFSFICLIIFNEIIIIYDSHYMMKSWNYGASGAVYAIMFATTAFIPNYSFKIFKINFLIKIKYIAIIIVISPIVLDNQNLQTHVAHLGGGFYGLLYIYLHKIKSENMVDKIISIFKSLFYYKTKNNKIIENDYDYNSRKIIEEKKINKILDKISNSGYSSLSKKEKDVLENYK